MPSTMDLKDLFVHLENIKVYCKRYKSLHVSPQPISPYFFSASTVF